MTGLTGPDVVGLFEGYGGLTAATIAVLGGSLVAYSEHEPPTKANPQPTQAPARVLAHRHPGVPNLGNITTADWGAVPRTAGAPLVVAGGFPCPDISVAGRRAGLRPGTRSGLWTHMTYAVQWLQPDLVVIENVRGLTSAAAVRDVEPCPWCVGAGGGKPALRALGAVVGDLADLGYDSRWCGLRAADVGAPHGRFRIFVIAWPAADPGERRRGPARGNDRLRAAGLVTVASADAASVGRREGRPEPARVVGGPDAAVGGVAASPDPDCDALWEQPVREPRRGGEAVSGRPVRDASLRGRHGAPATGGRDESARPAGGPGAAALAWGAYEPAIRRWEATIGRHAPDPIMTGRRGGQQLSPRFVEWMMGLPSGYVTDVPGVTRGEQLKMLGNGVVPAQAEAALRHLLGITAAGAA